MSARGPIAVILALVILSIVLIGMYSRQPVVTSDRDRASGRVEPVAEIETPFEALPPPVEEPSTPAEVEEEPELGGAEAALPDDAHDRPEESSATAPISRPPPGWLTVIASRRDNKNPAAGIPLYLGPRDNGVPTGAAHSQATDFDGIAVFEDVAPGSYELRINDVDSVSLTVYPARETEIEIEVEGGVEVRGIVVDDDGFGVAGAEIWMSLGPTALEGTEVARSENDGTFLLPLVPPGRWIGARQSRFVPSDLHQPLSAGEELRLELSADTATIFGEIYTDSGEPLPPTRIMAWVDRDPAWLESTGQGRVFPPAAIEVFSDEEGRFVFDQAPRRTTERVRFATWPTGYSVARARASGTEVLLRVTRGVQLTGHLSHKRGVATVEVLGYRDLGRRASRLQTRASRSGIYRLDGVPPGAEVEAQTLFGRSRTRVSSSAAGTVKTWSPKVDGTTDHGCRLVDSQGIPLAGWTVRIRYRGENTLAWTDESGLFRFRAVPLARVQIDAFPPYTFEPIEPQSPPLARQKIRVAPRQELTVTVSR